MQNDTSIPITVIVPFVQDSVGAWYVPGRPKMVMTSSQVDFANRKLQMKTRDHWGTSYSTESDRANIHTGDLCEEA